MKTTTDNQIKAIENTIAVIRASIWSFENGGKSPNALNDFANLGITTDKDYEKALKNLIAALEVSAETLKNENIQNGIDKAIQAAQDQIKNDIEDLAYGSSPSARNFVVWYGYDNGAI